MSPERTASPPRRAPRWHVDPRTCSHINDDVCPCCDFDRYYATTYADCPWRGEAS